MVKSYKWNQYYWENQNLGIPKLTIDTIKVMPISPNPLCTTKALFQKKMNKKPFNRISNRRSIIEIEIRPTTSGDSQWDRVQWKLRDGGDLEGDKIEATACTSFKYIRGKISTPCSPFTRWRVQALPFSIFLWINIIPVKKLKLLWANPFFICC